MLFLPRRWRRQPSYATEIDYGNPLALGLGFAFSGNSIIEPVKRTLITNNSSVIEPVGGVNESVIARATTSSKYFQLADNYAFTGALTLLVYFNNGGNQAVRISKCLSNGSTYNEFDISVYSGGVAELVRASSSLYAVRDTDSAMTGSSNVLCVTCADGDIANQAAWIFYNNGKLASSSAIHTGSGNVAASGKPIGFNRRDDGYSSGNVKYIAAYAWNRALSEGEVLGVSQNPWQIFKPQTAKIYSFPSGGASGSITGSSSLALGSSAALSGLGALSGTSSLSISGTATATGIGALAGIAALSLSGAATLTGAGALESVSEITLTAGGDLTAEAAGAIAGISSLAFAAQAMLSGTGGLAGIAALQLLAAAAAVQDLATAKEYTAPHGQIHYSSPHGKIHYTAPGN